MQLRISNREFHTILAALRYYQVQCETDRLPNWLEGLAANGGEVKPLNAKEIDHLCERLNTSEGEQDA